MSKKILVTGGAGYIGSTICHALADKGHIPIVLDSLVKGRQAFVKDFSFYKGDIADEHIIDTIFRDHPDICATIHCAALIVVPESMSHPFLYYKENVAKSNLFFHSLLKHGCKDLVFSGSASVYDTAPSFEVTEQSSLCPKSPYARSKWMVEQILEDFSRAYGMRPLVLRYFNPIGADTSLRCGPYDPSPTHILGQLVHVAQGKQECFSITGTQWPTRDGTGLRDYIHVRDLAEAHVRAIECLPAIFPHIKTLNLGTGQGVTVKEFVQAFERVVGHSISVKHAPARPGDVAGVYANATQAQEGLQWKATRTIEDGIRDSLRFAGHEGGNILSGLNQA